MTVQYGPWIAFNPGDTPPADDVMVQVQLANETRIQVERETGEERRSDLWTWTFSGNNGDIIAYRVVKQTVRGEVVVTGWLDEAGGVFSDEKVGTETHRLTLPTTDSKLIPGTYTGPDGATIKIEVL